MHGKMEKENRGGKREGAGRPLADVKKETRHIRMNDHELLAVKEFLKTLRNEKP